MANVINNSDMKTLKNDGSNSIAIAYFEKENGKTRKESAASRGIGGLFSDVTLFAIIRQLLDNNKSHVYCS